MSRPRSTPSPPSTAGPSQAARSGSLRRSRPATSCASLAARRRPALPALPADLPAVQRTVRAAFGHDMEARLIARLEREGRVAASIVALCAGQIAGHAMLSRLELTAAGGAAWPALALAPVAVAPGLQGRGIGSALVRRASPSPAPLLPVFVIGAPAFYGRFGFERRGRARRELALRRAGRATSWCGLRRSLPARPGGAVARVPGRPSAASEDRTAPGEHVLRRRVENSRGSNPIRRHDREPRQRARRAGHGSSRRSGSPRPDSEPERRTCVRHAAAARSTSRRSATPRLAELSVAPPLHG